MYIFTTDDEYVTGQVAIDTEEGVIDIVIDDSDVSYTLVPEDNAAAKDGHYDMTRCLGYLHVGPEKTIPLAGLFVRQKPRYYKNDITSVEILWSETPLKRW